MNQLKSVWENYLRGPLFLYFEIYTVATLLNSVIYLAKGLFEDPSGNWHEIDRAVMPRALPNKPAAQSCKRRKGLAACFDLIGMFYYAEQLALICRIRPLQAFN